MKILIVEDLFLMRRVIKQTLYTLGIQDIFEAKDGIEALKLLKTEICDVILLDWLMPNMNGIQFLDIIKNDTKYKNIIVIMISTVSDKYSIVQALKKGVNDYITKPFSPDCLIRKIKNIADKNNFKLENLKETIN